jgi:hypothetical protein
MQIRCKSDATTLRERRIHEQSDGGQNGGNGLIVVRNLVLEAGFKLREPAGQFLI